MRCAACGAVNDRGRAYCGSCAQPLADLCPACQFLNDKGVRYCGGCARDLLAPLAEPAPAAPASSADAIRPSSTRFPAIAFDDLGDLTPGVAPAAGGETPRTVAADATQNEIDNFFCRLVQEGVAEIHPAQAPVQPPEPPPSAPS